MKNNTMYIASLTEIREVETAHRITPHVDPGTWEAWGESAEQAKKMLCAALRKRLDGAKESHERAAERLQQAEAVELPA
jgi:hypothetical protein